MKKLYILRHAKSSYPQGVDDHERPLNERGQGACKLMGQYIKENNLIPEKILCSDATRTTQTINNILNEIGQDIPVDFLSKLYLATPGEIIKEIVKTDKIISSIMVVCHNPGVEMLSKTLTKSGDPESILRLKTKYPTAAMACFSVPIESWQDIQPTSANLDNFIIPKMLK